MSKTESLFNVLSEIANEYKDDTFEAISSLSKVYPTIEVYKTSIQGYIGNYLVIKHTFVVPVNNKGSFPISVLIYLGKAFPKHPPEIFLCINSNIDSSLIMANTDNVNINITSFEVKTQLLLYWSKTCHLYDIMEELEISFKKAFPIVKVKKPQKNEFSAKCFLKPISKVSLQYEEEPINNNNKNINSFEIKEANKSNNNKIINNTYSNSNSNESKPISSNAVNANPSNLFIKDVNDIFGGSSLINPNNNKIKLQVSAKANLNNNKNISNPPNLLESILLADKNSQDTLKTIIKNEILNMVEDQYLLKIDPKNKESLSINKDYEELHKNKMHLCNLIQKNKNYLNVIDTKIEEYHKSEDELLKIKSNNQTNTNISTVSLSAISQEIGLSPHTGDLVNLISVESTIEEMLHYIKKSCGNKNDDFDTSIRLVRNLMKELFKVKSLQKKYLLNNQ